MPAATAPVCSATGHSRLVRRPVRRPRAWAARLWCVGPLAAALALLPAAARADLWGFVDEAGVIHFAATQVDRRYQLYLKGADLSRLNPHTPALGLWPARLQASPGAPAALQRRFGHFDLAVGYKAVRHHIRAAAKAHGLDYALLKAVIAAESGFNPKALSPRGAVGLMQVLPTTASQYRLPAAHSPAQDMAQRLTDPRTNLWAGAQHLAYLLKLFKGDMRLALAAYNAGQGAVRRAGNQVPDYPETRRYVSTVMGLYQLFAAPAHAPPAGG